MVSPSLCSSLLSLRSNVLAKNSEDAESTLKIMLDTSKKIHELSVQMGGLGTTVEESAKKSQQLEKVIQTLPVLLETALEVQNISHSVRLAELREQGMGVLYGFILPSLNI